MPLNPYRGGPGSAPWNVRRGSHPGGMIKGPTPGRADRVPMNVQSGSFVVPADIPAALGQGNSQAGADILARMFQTIRPRRYAEGGGVEAEDGEGVPIQASDGEFLIDPETVAEIGNGDIKAGHRVLHKFSVAKSGVNTSPR